MTRGEPISGQDRVAGSLAVVSAHAADFCIRSAGALALHSKAGWRVSVICLTYGERGESPGCWQLGLPENEVKAVRRREAEAAAATLAVCIEFADWGDQPLVSTRERVEQLVAWLRRIRPEILLTHFPTDPSNPDHETASRMARDAAYFSSRDGVPGGPSAAMPEIYFFEPTLPFAVRAGFSPNVYVDISEVAELKFEAVECLASQPGLAERYRSLARSRAAEASSGRTPGIEYAEAFVRSGPWVGGLLSPSFPSR